MKNFNKFYVLGVLLVLFACNGEDAPDCLKTIGNPVEKAYILERFDKVTVYNGIELIVKQGDTQSVKVQTGANILEDIEVYVQDHTLNLKNNASCNYVRDYGETKVYITSPNLSVIRSSSGLPISSDGVLAYTALNLISEDYADKSYYRDGVFNLEVNSTRINVVFNGLSVLNISGQTNELNINFASGDCRFNGGQLIADTVSIYHRSSNDIIVNPQTNLTAKLVSTGNVVALNTPKMIDIEELYIGRVIFQ